MFCGGLSAESTGGFAWCLWCPKKFVSLTSLIKHGHKKHKEFVSKYLKTHSAQRSVPEEFFELSWWKKPNPFNRSEPFNGGWRKA